MLITVANSGRSFSAAADQTLLDAALDAKLNLPHSCKSGNCGACRARLMQGEVHYAYGSPLGLTDAEIAEMTQWFLEHTIDDRGFLRLVEPKVVLEVAFNNMMRSDRHESGYALRFPRIVRLRPDKSAGDADTIERAKEIFEKQS